MALRSAVYFRRYLTLQRKFHFYHSSTCLKLYHQIFNSLFYHWNISFFQQVLKKTPKNNIKFKNINFVCFAFLIEWNDSIFVDLYYLKKIHHFKSLIIFDFCLSLFVDLYYLFFFFFSFEIKWFKSYTSPVSNYFKIYIRLEVAGEISMNFRKWINWSCW